MVVVLLFVFHYVVMCFMCWCRVLLLCFFLFLLLFDINFLLILLFSVVLFLNVLVVMFVFSCWQFLWCCFCFCVITFSSLDNPLNIVYTNCVFFYVYLNIFMCILLLYSLLLILSVALIITIININMIIWWFVTPFFS